MTVAEYLLLFYLQTVQYFSDIGGAMGLYLGMSLMSILETFEFTADVIIYFIIRTSLYCKRRKQSKVTSTVKPISLLSMRIEMLNVFISATNVEKNSVS